MQEIKGMSREVMGILLFIGILIVLAIGYFYFRHTNNAGQLDVYANQLETLSQKIASSSDDINNETQTNELIEERIFLIASNTDLTEKYLVKNLDKKDDQKYQAIFSNYVLVKIGPVFDEPKKDIVSILNEKSGTTSAATTDDFDFHAYEVSNALRAIDDIHFKDNGGIFIFTDITGSGAYNFFSYVYGFEIKDNKINIKKLVPIDITKDGKVTPRILVKEDDWDYMVNVYYDASTSEIVETGMRAFGAYPCNSNDHYAVYPDRLVQISEDEPTACVGKIINGPEDLLFSDDENFGIITTLYTVPQNLIDQAKNIVIH